MGNIFYFFTFPKYINGGLGTTFCNQKTSDVVRRGPKWSNWTQFHRGGPCQYQQEGKNTKTPNQIRVTLLCHGVPEILTLHGMSKMDFEPDFRNPQMHSFPNMCNTMGSKMDGLAVREHFLSKIAEKTAFWAATFSDHLTSERSSTHNFKD